MSWIWVNRVLERSRAKKGARMVLLALAERANETGWCWPSMADIARRCGMSPRRARSAVARLVALGELERHIKRGRASTNRYRIVLPEPVAKSDASVLLNQELYRTIPALIPDDSGHKIGRYCPPNRKEPSGNLSPPISPPSGGDSSARTMPSADSRDEAEAAAIAKIRHELKGGAE